MNVKVISKFEKEMMCLPEKRNRKINEKFTSYDDEILSFVLNKSKAEVVEITKEVSEKNDDYVKDIVVSTASNLNMFGMEVDEIQKLDIETPIRNYAVNNGEMVIPKKCLSCSFFESQLKNNYEDFKNHLFIDADIQYKKNLVIDKLLHFISSEDHCIDSVKIELFSLADSSLQCRFLLNSSEFKLKLNIDDEFLRGLLNIYNNDVKNENFLAHVQMYKKKIDDDFSVILKKFIS